MAYYIGSLMEVSQEDAEVFLEEFEAMVEGIDGVGIFTHNLMLSLPMFIPGFGVAWGLFSAWQTGFAFAALATIYPALSEINPLAILFVSPFGLMELVAYSIAISRSFLLVHKLIKKIPIKGDLKPLAIEVGIVVALLVAGGFLEAYMIELVEKEGFEIFNLIQNSSLH